MMKNSKKMMILLGVMIFSLLFASAGMAANTVDVGALLKDNADRWVSSLEKGLTIESNQLIVTGGDEFEEIVGYNEQVGDSMFKLRAKFDLPKEWIYLGVRGSSPNSPIWGNTQMYGFFIDPSGGVSLGKWKNGGPTGDDIAKAADTGLADGKFHDIEFGAVNEGNGVRLVLKVDGKTHIDILDENDAFTNAGYMSIMTRGGTKATVEIASSGSAPAQSGQASGSTPAPVANPQTSDAGIALYVYLAAGALALAAVVAVRMRKQKAEM